MSRLFIDASYLIALLSPSDDLHNKAKELSRQIVDSGIALVTTRAVLLEVGNSLSKRRYRQMAAGALRSLEQNETVEIISISEDLYFKALSLYESRADKTWGLVDCVSFVVMEDLDISQALTADKHFRQMGFRTLLLED